MIRGAHRRHYRTIRRDPRRRRLPGSLDEVHTCATDVERSVPAPDDTWFTLAEPSALYFSRTLVEVLAATPFQQTWRRRSTAVGRAHARHAPVPRPPAAAIQAKGASRTGRPDTVKTEREHRQAADATSTTAAATMSDTLMSSTAKSVIEPYRPIYPADTCSRSYGA